MYSLKHLLILKKYDDWSNQSKIRDLWNFLREEKQKEIKQQRRIKKTKIKTKIKKKVNKWLFF